MKSRIILSSLLILICVVSLYAAVGWDNVFNGVAGSSTTFTVSTTVANNSNRALYAAMAYADNPTCNKTSSIAFNTSESLTSLGNAGDAGDIVCIELWRLVAPSITTANTVATLSPSEQGAMSVFSAFGIDQVTPERGSVCTQTGAPGSTSASCTMTTVAGDIVLSVMAVRTTTCDQAGSETEVSDLTMQGTSRRLCAEYLVASGVSTTIGWTFSATNGGFGMVSAVLKQSTSNTTVPSLMTLGVR